MPALVGTPFWIRGNTSNFVTSVDVVAGGRYHIKVHGVWKDGWIACRPDGRAINNNLPVC